MNIQLITAEDKTTISVTLDEAQVVNKVWIDTLDNISNLYEEEDEKHSYTVKQSGGSIDTVTIDCSTLSPELDTSAFVITINGIQGFYYDKKELYYKEIDLLTTFCSTCLDKHQKERMVLFMTKYHLLQYAEQNGLVEDQIDYYIDLARMLNIDFKYNAKPVCNQCKRIIKCCSNYCAIC